MQRGHIYTSFGSFFIQPIEEYTNENPNILHKISRENISAKVHLQNNDIKESHCDTCHNNKGKSLIKYMIIYNTIIKYLR